MLAGSHSILDIWRNHLSQLLNVNVVSDVRHIAIHTAKALVPEPCAFEVELPIEKLRDTNREILIRFDQH